MALTLTISQAAAVLDRSPVTLRSWEAKGYVTYQRIGNDRRFDGAGLRELVDVAEARGKMEPERAAQARAFSYMLDAL